MVVRIYSDNQLDKVTYDQIQDILKHSQCPNESLVYTFGERYHTMINLGGVVHVYFTDSAPDDAYCYEVQM